MSKVDAQRAMREARYAALQARRPVVAAPAPTAPAPTAPAPAPAKPAPAKPAPPAPAPVAELFPVATADEPAADGECGHRSIGNKSCRRPSGHAEKSHRYT